MVHVVVMVQITFSTTSMAVVVRGAGGVVHTPSSRERMLIAHSVVQLRRWMAKDTERKEQENEECAIPVLGWGGSTPEFLHFR